ncbi:hypothetical protein [Stygiolobus caldivivus]|uniref:Uncharacterized protein n=1 Tax=Stygiolobus caldivivus TaxID=2824673 RepID=A0A8D5U9A9_9CREN|nr:hypothetical protein [Stygiolobus caldivivus]BCU71106.1 hypothetical protein KN1_24030 [Stygiolobus caldivivus]
MVKQVSPKRYVLGFYLGAIAYFAVGLLLWKASNSVVPLFALPLISILTIGLGAYINSKIPKNALYPVYIGGNGNHWYFVSTEGLYKDKNLVLSWSDVAGLNVLESRTYKPENGQGKPVVTMRMVSKDIYTIGTLEITTKDGRRFVLEDIINPDQTVNFIKRNYLEML